jgi:hypothetical protein
MDHCRHRPASAACRAWRKWVVRGVVGAILAGVAGGAVVYERWTNPAETRREVIDKLTAQFQGVRVTLDSARLRLLGGIALYDLRLSRTGGLDPGEFLHVPSGILYLDKERLLDGHVSFRKIELYRPRLRIARGPDGRWNLAGLVRPEKTGEPVPMLVIHEGTVLLEDRKSAPDAPPLELHDVELTLIDDPGAALSFEGTGRSDLAGAVHFRGSRQRASDETALTVAAPEVHIDDAFVQRLAAHRAECAAHARQLRGLASVDADVVYRPESEPEWSYDVRCRLTKAQFGHARLPLPLEDLDASVHCVDGRVPEVTLSARSGATEVRLTARDVIPPGGPTLESWLGELDLHVRHLNVTPAVFEPLPEEVRDFDALYHPTGRASVDFSFRRLSPGRWKKHCHVEAEDVQGIYEKFRYPLEHVTGTLDADLSTDRDDVFTVNLAGRAAGQPVWLKGQVYGGHPCGVVLDLWGKNLPLDDTLLKALPEKYQALARSFHPSGLGDFKARIHRARGTAEFDNRFLIHFHDARMRYDVFPYPFENVAGDLDIQPDQWDFHDFHGTHNGGAFQTWGRCTHQPPGEKLEIHIKGKNAALDREMEAALQPEPDLAKTWQVFAPGGRVDFQGTVEKLPGQPTDIDVTVFPRGAHIRPRFFAYRLDDLRGRVRYAHRWVEVDQLRARHGDTSMSLGRGTIYVKPGGGVWAELQNLQGQPLLPDDDFVSALPETLRKACASLRLRDPVVLNTRLVIDCGPDPEVAPVIYWDGWAGLHDVSFSTGVRVEHASGQVACRGRHNGKQLDGVVGNVILKEATLFGGQRFEDLHTRVEVTPDAPEVLRLPGLYARYCGGEVYGPVRAEFGPGALRYEMKLTASEVHLEEFARQTNLGPDAQLSGLAGASLYLTGQGEDFGGLKGSGTVTVPHGKLYNLSPLLSLLKVVGLRQPDRTAFDELRAAFEIDGQRVRVHNVDLFGDAISLRGEGELNLDGTDINMDFNVDWARLPQLFPAGMKQIPHAISDQLLRIKMRGDLGDLRCTKEPVPMLLDHWRELIYGGQPEPAPGQSAAGR